MSRNLFALGPNRHYLVASTLTKYDDSSMFYQSFRDGFYAGMMFIDNDIRELLRDEVSASTMLRESVYDEIR